MGYAGFACLVIFVFFSASVDESNKRLATISLVIGCLFFMTGVYLEIYVPQHECPEVELSQNETPAEMTQAKRLHLSPQESP